MDSFSGRDGDDELQTRDGIAESGIACGAGADTVIADAVGVDVPALDCETVDLANTAPVAAALELSTNEDTATTVTVTATDADADPLSYAIVTGPSHGALSGHLDGDATFVYTPASNYNGPDEITFKANDGGIDSNTATISITVPPSTTLRSLRASRCPRTRTQRKGRHAGCDRRRLRLPDLHRRFWARSRER